MSPALAPAKLTTIHTSSILASRYTVESPQ
jgi:hypothetical protein